jgi:EAL domain-containing protein (putative c-di-GMP-specific phosphodiesterase class I)/CheY-like chemotaxis protein
MLESGNTARAPHPASPPTAHKGTVLVVEDELAIARGYQRVLGAQGYRVLTAGDGETARAILRHEVPDVVISDISMPGLDGLDLLTRIREIDPDLPVVFATGEQRDEMHCRAAERGALMLLNKPVDIRVLTQVVDHAMRLRAQTRPAAPLGPTRDAALDATLDAALAQLWIAYQPVVDDARHLVIGYEALVRSDSRDLGVPAVLFAAAERLGRVHDLGRAIRKRIAADLVASPPAGRIFVNLHAAELADDALFGPGEPLRPFARHIVLEITERTALHRIAGLEQRAEALRAAGFSLGVDGLGAGYAGLSAFVQLKPSVAKLDRSLVHDIDGSARNRRIVGALASICREMDIELIAEGVETDGERAALRDLGCDLQQGFIHARPERGLPPIAGKQA